jgi:gamma-glutamylaminecyclotransferase
MYLFVYGSLRRGLPNHFLLEKSIYMGTYSTVDKYHMIGQVSKSFPYVVAETEFADTNPTHIIGELYDIEADVLKDLDELEGHPDFYTRCTIQVSDQAATHTYSAYVYILENPGIISGLKNNSRFELVPSGDWLVYCGT